MSEPMSAPESVDFSKLPPRVKPEEMVEMHEEPELNELGAPAGEPGEEWIRRYGGG